MDTTSHEFQWEVFEFPSPYGSGVLRDVAIVSEDDIWAVGEIYSDTAQTWLPYNAVHWDGQRWELKRISFTGWCSAVEFPPVRSVLAFSENDIWFARGGSLVHYNGNSFYNDCEMNPLLDGSISKIWGTNSNNLYIVGGSGTIAHYNGSSWQKLESGTDVDLLDVWGSPDGGVVWACGWSTAKPTVLLRYENGILEKIYEDRDHRFVVLHDTLSGTLTSGWIFDNRSQYVASNAGVYRIPTSGAGKIERLSFTPSWFPGFPFRLRGEGINDMILTGDYFMVAHFNGLSWRYYQQLSGLGAYLSVAQRANMICAVGLSFDLLSRAIILVGKR